MKPSAIWKKTCDELGLTLLKGEAGIISYSSFYVKLYVKQIARSQQIRSNLTALYRFCQASDYEKVVYDFYLLYWAWDDFDHLDNYTHYWPKATPQNVEQIVTDTAKDWLIKNKILFD